MKIFECNKCGGKVVIEDNAIPPVMCVADFPQRTSGICGGAFIDITDVSTLSKKAKKIVFITSTSASW